MNTDSTTNQTVRFDPEAQAQAGRLQLARQAIEAFELETQDDYTTAADMVRDATTIAGALEEKRLAITRPMDEAKKRVMDLFRAPIDIATEIVAIGKRKMAAYHDAQERKRVESERAARVEAARQERERQAAERARLEEIERQAAAERKAATERMAAAVQSGDATGAAQAAFDLDAADDNEQTARATVADMVPTIQASVPSRYVPPAPRVSGVSSRTLWRAEVESLETLVIAAAMRLRQTPPDRSLLGLLQVDETALRKLAEALRENAAVPGVRVFASTSIAAGARR